MQAILIEMHKVILCKLKETDLDAIIEMLESEGYTQQQINQLINSVDC